MSDGLNVLMLEKGNERYVFMYADNRRAEVLRTLGSYASNPELNFSWYDAAVLAKKVRDAKVATNRFQLPQVKP